MTVETEELQHQPKEDKLQIQHQNVEGGGDKEQVPAQHLQQVPGLQENEEHLSEGKDQTAVNQLSQGIKDAWRET